MLSSFKHVHHRNVTPLLAGRYSFSSAGAPSQPSNPTPSTDFWTIPNAITMSRIAASPMLTYLILTDQMRPALYLACVAGASDFLDGYLARKWNQCTVAGSFLDPLSDKVMVGCLGVALTMKGILNPWIVAVVVGRDVALVAGVAIYRYMELPPAQRTLEHYFQINDAPTHEITPNMLSKVNTGFQMAWLSLGLASLAFGVPSVESQIVDYLGYGVLSTTIASGVSYALKRGMKARTA
jgi:cardiolipin synthase